MPKGINPKEAKNCRDQMGEADFMSRKIKKTATFLEKKLEDFPDEEAH